MLDWILGLLVPVAFVVGLRLGATRRLLGDALAAGNVKRHARDVNDDAA